MLLNARLPVTAIYITPNPFSFKHTTLLQTSTCQNEKFDIKNAGFMRPAITFLNIQLSNSRDKIAAMLLIDKDCSFTDC